MLDHERSGDRRLVSGLSAMAIFPRAKADVSEAVSPRECRGLSLETGPICLCGLLEAQVSSQRLAAILWSTFLFHCLVWAWRLFLEKPSKGNVGSFETRGVFRVWFASQCATFQYSFVAHILISRERINRRPQPQAPSSKPRTHHHSDFVIQSWWWVLGSCGLLIILFLINDIGQEINNRQKENRPRDRRRREKERIAHKKRIAEKRNWESRRKNGHVTIQILNFSFSAGLFSFYKRDVKRTRKTRIIRNRD